MVGCGYAQSPTMRVEPQTAYRVSGYGMTEDDWQNNSCIKVKWFDKDSKPLSWEYVLRDSFTKTWQRYEKLVLAPRDAAFGAIVCHAQAVIDKSSRFTGVSLTPAKRSPLLWDMHFDNLNNGWIKDRSPYRNDGKAYCLSLDDYMVTQAGGTMAFNNRKAKVRFFQSASLSPAQQDQWVLVVQFFLEEPVTPIDQVPDSAVYNILGARWNTSIAYVKEGDTRKLVTTFYSYKPDGSSTNPAVILPIEPWKWYRLTLIVNNRDRVIKARLLKDGNEVVEAQCAIKTGQIVDPPFFYVGCLDFPRSGRRAYPWGFWGKLDYLKLYDSKTAYEADLKNIVFGGFGKP